MNPEQRQQLESWSRNTKFIYRAHYESAKCLELYHLGLGLPVVILSAIVGTSVFATLNRTPDDRLQILVGLISMLVTVLASLQTFLRFGERAEKHKECGARFSALHKEVDQVLVVPPRDEDALQAWMTDF